ncbi:hypothetical protein PAF15_06595 [Weissella koreensis]|nr:hypothetical protein [Weissella koreensis]MCZ9311607.1 hypothetical protein [Weissella koreensis]
MSVVIHLTASGLWAFLIICVLGLPAIIKAFKSDDKTKKKR